MHVFTGQELVNEFRKLADTVKRRLWVCVPYIGGVRLVTQVLGKNWHDEASVNVKLITDVSDLSCINTDTLMFFKERGEIRTLLGLHAKIYIVDDSCIISSANLTNTAFTKRQEIGVFLKGREAMETIKIFSKLWDSSEPIPVEKMAEVRDTHHESCEDYKPRFPTRFKLPENPGAPTKNLSKKFLNYQSLVDEFNSFAQLYLKGVKRIWPDTPINFEIDGLFDYLFHSDPKTPSKEFSDGSYAILTEVQQMRRIESAAKKYKIWNEQKMNGKDIYWRLDRSETIKQLSSPDQILKLDKSKIEELLLCTNSMRSDQRNLAKILKDNSIKEIRSALNELINSPAELSSRMAYCNRIRGIGQSTMNELVGFANPENYPLINKNSCSGLRYFGYQIKAHS